MLSLLSALEGARLLISSPKNSSRMTAILSCFLFNDLCHVLRLVSSLTTVFHNHITIVDINMLWYDASTSGAFSAGVCSAGQFKVDAYKE